MQVLRNISEQHGMSSLLGVKAQILRNEKCRDSSWPQEAYFLCKAHQEMPQHLSPQLQEFIQQMRSQCEKALKLPSKSKERQESIRSTSVHDGLLHSYWYLFSINVSIEKSILLKRILTGRNSTALMARVTR